MIKYQKLQMIRMNNDYIEAKDELSYKVRIFKNLKKIKYEQNRMIVTFCFVIYIYIVYFCIYYKIFSVQIKLQFY